MVLALQGKSKRGKRELNAARAAAAVTLGALLLPELPS